MDRIQGRTQHYAWGSSDAIAAIRGTEPTGNPEAEYWLGAHSSAPSTIGDHPLDAALAEHPELVGRRSVEEFGPRLPYLLKLLAAAQPLSLQAHPTRAQAEEGFARENEAGVALDAPERTYKDDWPKPETIVALTEFSALCGFRDPARTCELFQALEVPVDLGSILGPLTERRGAAGIAEVFLDILSLDEERRPLVEQVVAAAVRHVDADGELGQLARTAVEVDQYYPGDPSILAALMLNRVDLQPGEALFLDAGVMHAYLKGTGVEIMANSDNVLRGGLTPKHIDVDQLVSVVCFEPTPAEPIECREVSFGVFRYLTPAPEFALWRIDLPDEQASVPDAGARILLMTDGHATVTCGDESLDLSSGDAVFLPAADTGVRIAGRGQAFVAAPGVEAGKA